MPVHAPLQDQLRSAAGRVQVAVQSVAAHQPVGLHPVVGPPHQREHLAAGPGVHGGVGDLGGGPGETVKPYILSAGLTGETIV